MEFIKREWFKLTLLLLAIFLIASVMYAGPQTESQKSMEKMPINTTEQAVDVMDHEKKLTISTVLKNIYEKDRYNKFIAADEKRVWFAKRHETAGCSYFSYIELATGTEYESQLRTCPVIPVSVSYPFYIENCRFTQCYDGNTLYVTNLLTLERKVVHSIASEYESSIKSCAEATVGEYCDADISYRGGIIEVGIYKSEPVKQFIYENTELLRRETVDLFKLFDTKILKEDR